MSGPDLAAGPLHASFDAVLFDLDGVCFEGNRPIPHAATAIAELRGRGQAIRYVTNNASRTHAQVVEHLALVGIEGSEEEVVTSSDAIAAVMASELPTGSRVLTIGADGLLAAVSAAGLVPVATAEDVPVAVVQGFGPTVGWSDLAEAAYAIERGARYYASNLDLTLPTERGFAPGNGALVGAVTTATGVRPIAAGKPAPGIFLAAARSAAAADALMVGDRLDTDIRGAKDARMTAALVLTGVHGVVDAALAPPRDRPDCLLADLRGLVEPYAAPFPADGGWRLGHATARWEGDSLVARGGGRLERARCVCAATWQVLDAGLSVSAASLARWDSM